MKQCYNTKTFDSISYILVDDIWVPKYEGDSVVTSSSPKSRTSHLCVPSSSSLDVTIRRAEIDLKLDSINNLLLSSHFYLNKMKDVSKKNSTDVACFRVRLDQVIKEAMKIAAKIQTTTDSLYYYIHSVH